MDNLNTSIVGNLCILVPPIKEQEMISEKVKKIDSEVGSVEENMRKAIAKLKEYRTALITNAVTGKIDVRDFEIPEAA